MGFLGWGAACTCTAAQLLKVEDHSPVILDLTTRKPDGAPAGVSQPSHVWMPTFHGIYHTQEVAPVGTPSRLLYTCIIHSLQDTIALATYMAAMPQVQLLS